MALRFLSSLLLIGLVLSLAAPAEGGSAKAISCGSDYSYAGVQSQSTAAGVSTELTPVQTPAVAEGHVGGWIGVGGPGMGPGGSTEWLQVGFASFPQDSTNRIYYEVAQPGKNPRYVELATDVPASQTHRFAVLEIAGRDSWWRVWLDGKAVSPAIHLPGSHHAWAPQAVAESWNNGTRTCNAFSYRFSKVMLAASGGGNWKPLTRSSSFQDTGYKVVQTSNVPRSFLAASRS